MTPLPDLDVAVGHSFGLELDGVEIKAIAEVSGLRIERDVIELKENSPDGQVVVRRLPGRWKASEITLTRGLTADGGFHTWVKKSQGAKADATGTGSLTVFDAEGAQVRRYVFVNPWPKSFEVLPVTAGQSTILAERLVLVCDQLTLE